MDFDEITFRDDVNTYDNAARKAYLKGAASTAHELRQNIRDAAIAGSPYSIAECQRQLMAMLTEITT